MFWPHGAQIDNHQFCALATPNAKAISGRHAAGWWYNYQLLVYTSRVPKESADGLLFA